MSHPKDLVPSIINTPTVAAGPFLQRAVRTCSSQYPIIESLARAFYGTISDTVDYAERTISSECLGA